MTLSLNMSIAGIIAQGIFDYPMLPGNFNKYIVIPPTYLVRLCGSSLYPLC
jgi:hypothetical protein